jgi:hypothetical protein
MPIVYRVEHEQTGEGPFRLQTPEDEDGTTWPLLDGTPAMRQPMPHEDVTLRALMVERFGDPDGWWKSGWRSGCATPEALLATFGDALTITRLAGRGIVVRALEGPTDPRRVLIGDAHAMIAPSWYVRARALATWPIEALTAGPDALRIPGPSTTARPMRSAPTRERATRR